MDDLVFLDQFSGECDSSTATLKVLLPDGQVVTISDRVCPWQLLDHCPLLYHAFENGYQAHLQASVEAPSPTAIISILRYCYTGSYLPPGTENAPITLLPHAEVYKMAESFDMPALQLLAHGNFTCQIDFACSLPCPPQDLLATIRFVYSHFASPQSRQQQGLIHTLLNYCISVFQYHKLGQNADFLDVVRHIPEFHQDLCRTNMERNFEDDCALEIVQLALDTLQPQYSVRPTTLASRDLPREMLIDRPPAPTPTRVNVFDPVYDAVNSIKLEGSSNDDQKMEASEPSCARPSDDSTLVFRPKNPELIKFPDFETDSSSEDEGYSIVHRPKVPERSTPDEPMSSPEMIPSQPIDVLAVTGSNYPNDDEWTML